jgi:excisionase family DNA binding protein
MDTTQTIEPVLLTPREVMSLLNISRTTFFKLIAAGELKSVRIGRAVRIPREAVDDFVRKLPSAETAYRNVA